MPLIRIQDILDILFMTTLVYLLYSWFRRSRAIQVLGGLGVVLAIFFVTRQAGLHMTSWVLQQLETVMIVLVVVVFQNEIRQALYRFNLLREMIGPHHERQCSGAATVATAAFDLAAERTGAIIVFQREDQLDDHLLHGVELDSTLSAPLLRSIFTDSTPLHDGAVLIRNERVVTAACLLPLSDNQHLPQQYGTRHRAAVGLTERSDAVVLVISEERGEVSLVLDGDLETMTDSAQLQERLETLLTPVRQPTRRSLPQLLFSDLLPKTAILLGVTAVWLLLAARQGEVAIVPATLTFHGLPNGLALVRVAPEEVNVRVRSTSGLAPSPRQLDLDADLDLSTVQEGINTLRIGASQIRTPSGVAVVGVEPTSVRVTIRTIPPKK